MKALHGLLDYDRANRDQPGTSTDECLFLHALVTMLGATSAVEVGVSCGYSLMWIAAAVQRNAARAKGGKPPTPVVYAVDDWSRRSGGQAKNHKKAEFRLQENGLRDTVKFRAMPSAKFWPDAPVVDFVWIDGWHDEDAAFKDVMQGMHLARKAVAVHDIVSHRGQVKRCCERVEKELGVKGLWLGEFNGIWLYQRGWREK